MVLIKDHGLKMQNILLLTEFFPQLFYFVNFVLNFTYRWFIGDERWKIPNTRRLDLIWIVSFLSCSVHTNDNFKCQNIHNPLLIQQMRTSLIERTTWNSSRSVIEAIFEIPFQLTEVIEYFNLIFNFKFRFINGVSFHFCMKKVLKQYNLSVLISYYL